MGQIPAARLCIFICIKRVGLSKLDVEHNGHLYVLRLTVGIIFDTTCDLICLLCAVLQPSHFSTWSSKFVIST